MVSQLQGADLQVEDPLELEGPPALEDSDGGESDEEDEARSKDEEEGEGYIEEVQDPLGFDADISDAEEEAPELVAVQEARVVADSRGDTPDPPPCCSFLIHRQFPHSYFSCSGGACSSRSKEAEASICLL